MNRVKAHTRLRTKRGLAFVALALQLLLLNAGCSRRPPALPPDAASLRRQLIEHYGHGDVEVVQYPDALGVFFVNSRFDQLPEADRQKLALHVGVFVTNHYAPINEVKTVKVSFVAAETYAFVFSYTENYDYQFDKNYLVNAGLVRKPAEEVVRAEAKYSEQQGETTVLVNNLQLDGDLNKGLVLIPSFIVRGKKIVPPRQVELEFASYDVRKVFDRNRDIAITADNKKVHSGTARLVSSGKTAEGYVSEFLMHRISYDEFLQVAGGRDVELRVGPKVIKLTPEHLRLLRQMKECVDASRCE